jgi:non-ribosomal peptide synthetase component E (peptide arylation enzyme)
MAPLEADNSHKILVADCMPSPPPVVNKLVHDVIKSHAVAHPSRHAVVSASINLTYQELESASSWLAIRITSLGVGSNSIVPIICEKV